MFQQKYSKCPHIKIDSMLSQYKLRMIFFGIKNEIHTLQREKHACFNPYTSNIFQLSTQLDFARLGKSFKTCNRNNGKDMIILV